MNQFAMRDARDLKDDDVTIIVADNVFEYLADLAGDGERRYVAKDFPCIMPPFRKTWIEFHSEVPYAKFDDAEFHDMGCMVELQEGAPNTPEELRERYPETEHELRMTLWAQKKGNPTFLSCLHTMLLDERGAPLCDQVPAVGPFGTVEMAKGMIVPIMMTLNFLNFRNVSRVDATETEGPSAKWIRRQKQPTLRYHVLQINPLKEIIRKEGNVEGDGLGKALHKVRGHMVHYSEEKPLFGKYAGTFWVPPHDRGNPKFGTVKKDYRVNMGDVKKFSV
jgi:hypothetical protein